MYTPKAFQIDDDTLIRRVIDENPFATVISPDHISHLPVLIDRNSENLKLFSHVSRFNPHCEALYDGAITTVVVHGPHAYISPTWYQNNDVPTWNYIALHLKGSVKRIDTCDGLLPLLARTSEAFESQKTAPWDFELPEDLLPVERLPELIWGFEVIVDSITAKFKLNQNRSLEDQKRVIAGLRQERRDDQSLAIARWMEELLNNTER